MGAQDNQNLYKVSIPQAVGTIAMRKGIQNEKINDSSNVSIPQAVGTIAIAVPSGVNIPLPARFNTASGRYYCN